jgi:hypothetical protein
MHNKHAKDGLAAVSVGLLVDPPPPSSKLRGKMEKFLREQKATFTNVVLLEDTDGWTKKLDIQALPCVYVFDRDNHWVKKLVEDQVDYGVVEKEVVRLLGK